MDINQPPTRKRLAIGFAAVPLDADDAITHVAVIGHVAGQRSSARVFAEASPTKAIAAFRKALRKPRAATPRPRIVIEHVFVAATPIRLFKS